MHRALKRKVLVEFTKCYEFRFPWEFDYKEESYSIILTHRLKIAKSRAECVSLGKMAALPGTLITPTN